MSVVKKDCHKAVFLRILKGTVMDLKNVQAYIKGKVCMVTGGGGSIGSEIVRSLSELNAKKIIIVDIYENGAYNIKCELGDRVTVEIASVRDYDKMDCLMNKYRPNIVFHTAAHKHVPFMENNPEEAVKNNIKGTETVADLSEKYRVDNFVLISTDKAVEPISIMGASKRCCEMYVYEKSINAKHTKFFAVRFGNVLNSNGSVIPLFKKQIESGVVTVTDKDVTRYFMTIQQAVELVLMSIEFAVGGEIFVLDMGDAVRILDVAEKVIKDSGKVPYEDVKIKFTKLRKGDKLHEKLFFDFEQPHRTRCEKIMRISGSSVENFFDKLSKLYEKAYKNDTDGVRELIMKMTNSADTYCKKK